MYLTKVLDERTELLSQGKWDEKTHSEARNKLLAALESSSFNAERVLQRLPVDGLYEERAFLLGRMRQHRLALTLYAHKVCNMNFLMQYALMSSPKISETLAFHLCNIVEKLLA